MSRLDQNVAIRQTIEDLCAARDQAIAEFETARRCIERSEQALAAVGSYLYPGRDANVMGTAEFTKEVDRRLWHRAFDLVGLSQYMDRKAKLEFEQSLKHEPPEFTLENCQSNLLGAAAQADTFFVRGLVEFFLRLSRDYKTNSREPFKVDRKAIVRNTVTSWLGYMSVNYGSYSCGSETINDLDRVFKTLDGKKHRPRELEAAINAAWKEGQVFEDEYYRIKGFKNGNAHIEFKRADLLDKANRLIHDWYEGRALAEEAA